MPFLAPVNGLEVGFERGCQLYFSGTIELLMKTGVNTFVIIINSNLENFVDEDKNQINSQKKKKHILK